MKAIAYTYDVILGKTGDIITKNEQKQAIEAYAKENHIKIIEWIDDEIYNENIMDRPGIQKLLKSDFDIVLFERIWVLSRRISDLEPFLKEMEKREIRIECATTMWDCVSQIVRRRFTPVLYQPKVNHVYQEVRVYEKAKVSKPKKLVFARFLK
ncbi:MAG: recombinase family protein [Candidatus Paceibacterota bacterium]|jgi:DNA invertase Pin-like site-specific DNA recombinase